MHGRGRAPVIHQPLDFRIADINTLQANRPGRVRGLVEHIAAAQQAFGAGLVQNDAAVGPGSDRERNARREVGLDQAGDHVHRRALCGQDQMNAGGAGQLRQAGDSPLGFVGGQHHQVSQFVDHGDNVGQFNRLLAVVILDIARPHL